MTKELEEEVLCVDIDIKIVLPQQNAFFYTISGYKTNVYHQNEKQHLKLFISLERCDQNDLFSLVLGCKHI